MSFLTGVERHATVSKLEIDVACFVNANKESKV